MGFVTSLSKISETKGYICPHHFKHIFWHVTAKCKHVVKNKTNYSDRIHLGVEKVAV